VEKEVLDIQVVNRPTPREGQSQNNVHGSGLHHGVESLIMVHIEVFGEIPYDLMSLVLVQGTICLELMFEDPHFSHNIGAEGRNTNSQVLLDNGASYSSSIARSRQRPGWETVMVKR
jgi:hypothetical protein